jgi:hypothetical protein
MATNLNKIEIKPRSAAYPIKKMAGLTRDGQVTDQLDFFKDSIRDDWWEFFEMVSLPEYHEDEISFTIGVKSNYTCTGTDAELEQSKAEYLKVGLTELCRFYGKSFTDSTIAKLSEDTDNETGSPISSIIDYHMSSRPGAKLKFLVEIDARYFNALSDEAPPSSFTDNLDVEGNLITSNGLLNPALGSDGNLNSYEDISIVTLSSNTGRGGYETEIEKTAFYMSQMHRDMMSNAIKIRGLDLTNEASRLRLIPPVIQDFIGFNFSADGYSTGESNEVKIEENRRNMPLPITGRDYLIRFAFKEQTDGVFRILWACVPTDNGEVFLKNGFERFVTSNPLDNQTSIKYFYYHQQILNNLDRNIELNFADFLQAYHHPAIDLASLLSGVQKTNPFETASGASPSEYGGTGKDFPYFIETDPGAVFQKPRKVCGFKFPDLPDFNLSFLDLLQQLLEPVNFKAELKLTFFAIGPPCPAPFTGDTLPAILEETGRKLKNKILKQKKVIDKTAEEAAETFDYVGDYFTSEEYINDLEKRFANPNNGFLLKMRQLGDMVMNQFGVEKMLKLVCICIAQIGDDLLAEQGVELQVPNGSMSIASPGVSFDPALLSDDPDQNFNMKQAFDANLGSFNMPVGMKPFQLEQLCSFCVVLPDILLKLPTLDLLKELLDLLLALLEALLVHIIMQLILSLLKWLTRCPDFQCELRPTDVAADDYGSLNLPDFFPDAGSDAGLGDEPFPDASRQPPVLANCPALFGIADAVPDLQLIQEKLFSRISEELSSGELLNVLEGYPSQSSVFVIREIIDMESDFSEIKPFIDSYSKVEALIDCIFDNADPAKVENFNNATKDPEYCPDPSKNPAIYMRDKCNNEKQIERFLLRESTNKAAKLKGIIDALRSDPNFFDDMFPDLFSTRDPDTNELKPGLLADDKFKPPMVDTLIEQYDPFIDQINVTARGEGGTVLRAMYQNGMPTSDIPGDSDLKTNAIVQLVAAAAGATVALPVPPPVGVGLLALASSLSPNNQNNPINSDYPIVGGKNLRDALNTIESNGGYSVTDTPGASSKFNGIPSVQIPDRGSREFNTRIHLSYPNDGGKAIEFYFESITDTLKATGAKNGYGNHAIVRVKSPELFNTNDYIAFGYEVPLNYDNDATLEALTSVDLLNLTAPADLELQPWTVDSAAPAQFSPQGLVFAQLIEKGMPDVFNSMSPTAKEKFRAKLAGEVHLTAFRDYVEAIGRAAQQSPYFKTYVWEDLKGGVGDDNLKTSNFGRFGRKNPYTKGTATFGIGPFQFGEFFSAKDKNPNGGRTSIWWQPTPAISDTPLRSGKYLDGTCVNYIDADSMKEKIKENWDWSEQYDPSNLDPNYLPPMANAILDELIPETVKFYCLDAAIKSMPVTKIFKPKGSKAFRDDMFAGVIAELMLKEFDQFDTSIKSKFFTQVEKYWERRYKKDENLNVENAPKSLTAIKELVNENIGDAMELASGITNIRHLDEDAQKITIPSEAVIQSGPNANGLFYVPNLLGSEHTSFIDNDMPKSRSKYSKSYRSVGGISRGGFIFEAFVQLDLHQETKEWVAAKFGNDFLNNLVNVPLSIDGLEKAFLQEIPDDNINPITGEIVKIAELNTLLQTTASLPAKEESPHILKTFLGALWMAPPYEIGTSYIPNELKNIIRPVGDAGVGLFKEFKVGIRFSYAISNNNAVEELFNDIAVTSDSFYANILGGIGMLGGAQGGGPEPLVGAIIKNKSFLFEEAYTVDGVAKTNKILTFPIDTEFFNQPPTFNMIFAENSKVPNGTVFSKGSRYTKWVKNHLPTAQAEYSGDNVFSALLGTGGVYKVIAQIQDILLPSVKEITTTQQVLNPELDIMEWMKAGSPQDGLEGVPVFNEIEVPVFGDNGLPLTETISRLDDYLKDSKFSKKDLAASFDNSNAWKAMTNYALPQGLASNIVSLYAYLNLIKGLGSFKTFNSTKELYKLFFISATTKSGKDGKPQNGNFDSSGLVPEGHEPPTLDEDGNPLPQESPFEDNC